MGWDFFFFLQHVQPAKSMPEEKMSLSLLSEFLIGTLFGSIMNAKDQPIQDSSSSPHPMEEWFWAYRYVIVHACIVHLTGCMRRVSRAYYLVRLFLAGL